VCVCVCVCVCLCAVLTLGAMRCSCLRVMRLYMVLMSFLWSSYSDTVIWREEILINTAHTNACTYMHERTQSVRKHVQTAHIGQSGLQLYNLLGLLCGVVSSQHAQQALHQSLVRSQDLQSNVTSVLTDNRFCTDLINMTSDQGGVTKWTGQ